MPSCEVNDIFEGEVSSVQNYGAFVKIPGCIQQGLIHRSQVSSTHVDDVTEVLKRGEKVWCKVISINDDGKIALSMKLVNQGNGKDLDPNNVQLELDEQKRKKPNYKDERKAIVLDAVFKTTCSKCKTPGHLSKDCFTVPGGKKYELLPEINEKESILQPKIETEKAKEKKHKSKKSKKKKKSKLSKKDTSDSESSDSSDEKTKKKKKKKEKKRKKRKHSSSSDDSIDNNIKKHSKKCKHSKSKYSD